MHDGNGSGWQDVAKHRMRELTLFSTYNTLKSSVKSSKGIVLPVR